MTGTDILAIIIGFMVGWFLYDLIRTNRGNTNAS